MTPDTYYGKGREMAQHQPIHKIRSETKRLLARRRLVAWRKAKAAQAALKAYAIAAENIEQPVMSDDAIDANDLADLMWKYEHCFR